MKLIHLIAAALVVLITMSGCMESNPNKRATIGAGVGAVVGAVIGHNVGNGDNSNKVIGAVVGALAGGAVGHYMDVQAKELKVALEDELAADHAYVRRIDEDTIKVGLDSEASFDIDSAIVKDSMRLALNRVASVMNKYDKTVVYIIGHTDSVGSNTYNQALSERRADSVESNLLGQGVNPERLFAEGRGETEPRTSNSTASGRKLNRRVEMLINAVVAGKEQQAFVNPYGA